MTDTAAKRASVIGISLPWRGPLGVYLDATVSDQDRAATAYLYRGIDYAGDGDDEAANDWLIMARRRGSR